jgi:hypothetical protein
VTTVSRCCQYAAIALLLAAKQPVRSPNSTTAAVSFPLPTPRQHSHSPTALKYNYDACDNAHDSFLDNSNIQDYLSAAQSIIMGSTFFVICGFSLMSCIRLYAMQKPSAVNNQLLAQLTEDSGVRDIISKESTRNIQYSLKFRYLFVMFWAIVAMLSRASFETLFGATGFAPQSDDCSVCGDCQTSTFILFTILVNEPIIQAR